jgi:Putative beta-barrel porin-2, OmpL-like. bbp2
MKPSLSTGLRAGAACLLAAAWNVGTQTPAWAQQPAPPAAPGAPAPEAAAPASNAMAVPAMIGPLVANPNPMNTDAGDIGTYYFTGVISGLALFQSDPVVGNHQTSLDLSNGQFIVQKTDGLLQFYAQGGLYTLPALGTPYFHVAKTTGDTYGLFPVGYAKLAPNDAFSVLAGKLPTLIGAEDTFTFQNTNIERGLLWNQENAVNRGIQGNYTLGPLALSLSLNDGFYSGNYNWVSGLAAWTINKENTLTVAAGGNVDRTTKATFVTPLAQNNSTIVNLIYTYNAAPWTITPYFQYTNVPANAALGFGQDASTWGGAVLANYSINDNWNLAGRGEFIGSSGSAAKGAPNLLYGQGSSALSFTLTPTWQQGVFFVRADASVVSAFSTTAGAAFGKSGNSTTQGRFVLETGIIF